MSVHFTPISLFITESVARHGKYSREKTIKLKADAVVKLIGFDKIVSDKARVFKFSALTPLIIFIEETIISFAIIPVSKAQVRP